MMRVKDQRARECENDDKGKWRRAAGIVKYTLVGQGFLTSKGGLCL